MWPKCKYGERPLAAVRLGLVAVVGVTGELGPQELLPCLAGAAVTAGNRPGLRGDR